jgi:hypothetical protein
VAYQFKATGLFAALALSMVPAAACAQDAPPPAEQPAEQVELTAAQLFQFAEDARGRAEFETAEAAYQALANDPDVDLRTEARFRLALMYMDQMNRPRDAAVLLRRILDEKPDAARVRVELARVQVSLGNLGDAARELRAAEAAGLPPEVERQVRFFANALSAQKRFGGGFEFALAPSTNVNRATSSDTLGTIIGDFILSDDAKAKSGIGASLKAQTYYRLPAGATTDILLRASTSGDIYREKQFDDISISLQAGPQWQWGRDRLALSAATTWRWYGMDPLGFSYGVTGNWQHPLDPRTQLRIDGSFIEENNKRNDLEDGERYTLAVGVDHAFSPRFGGGFQLNGTRTVAGDPGYSNAAGGVNTYVYRELGRTTAVVNLGYRHFESDARLFLYPERRKDDYISVSLSATFRALTFGRFAPLVRVGYEHNWSTVEIYSFDRFYSEVGIVAAF